MPRQLTVMITAPFIKSFVIIMNVQVIHCGIIFLSERIPPFVVQKKIYESVFYVLPVIFFEKLFTSGRVRSFVPVKLRFVGKKAGKFFAETFFESCIVFFVRFRYKRIGKFGI